MADLNYNHLRYFWAVAHAESLTEAARRLNLSQSALSVQIKKLEDRLGHELFERRNRQLHLTEAGRIALDHADAIMAAGEELLGTLNETGSTRRALRIGALATLSRNFQMSILRPLIGRTDVEVVLRSGGTEELLRGLEGLTLDMVLSNRPPSRDAATSFTVHRLAEQEVELVGRPDLSTGFASAAEALRRRPVILPTRETSLREDFDALADRWQVRPQIAAEVDDMAMMRLLAREGAGLAVLPPIVVTDELESGFLTEAAKLPGLVERFYAVTMERRFPNPLVRDLLDALPTD